MAAYLNWFFIFLYGVGVFFSHAVTADFQKINDEVDRDMNFRSQDSTVPFEKVTIDKLAASSTADHSKYDVLRGPFDSGSDVTKACLSCHTEAGKHFMQSIHWTWEYTHPETGQQLGKKTLINTFCTNSRGNEGMCAQCHAGYGWEDDSFDFSNQNNIDCLVCHDRSGSYYKVPPSEGNKTCSIMFEDKKTIDLVKVAQSVGLPGRENCGGCHFYGGGGDGVKHGDLDSSLKKPSRQLDIHMDAVGLNFSCSECHVTNKHIWAGSRYNVIAKDTGGTGKPGLRRDVATCESCHGDSPHSDNNLAGFKLNQHVEKIACQSCHIPTIARGGIATKTEWDWRTAGKTIDGEGYKEHDYTQGNGEHRATYKSIKGSFKYGENLVPYYDWFDGQMIYTTIETTFDPNSGPVSINRFKGSADDGKSRIWPFKRMQTIQPYDKGKNTLVYMHLWGNDKDAYWGNYNFANAIRVGMEKNSIPYSGEFGFVDTYSFWPITHMVAPKEDALSCVECHSQQSRLQNIEGIYLPGRDSSEWLDRIGWLAIMATLLGVLGHGLIRIIARKRGNLL